MSQDREVGQLGYYAITAAGVLAAVRPGHRMRMLCYTVLTSVDGTVDFTSDNDAGSGSGRVLTGDMPFSANGGVSTTLAALGHFISDADETIWVNVAGGALVTGHCTVEWVKTFTR